jgi:antitoxin component YwqK of YwqJK toxin-antitoxin module
MFSAVICLISLSVAGQDVLNENGYNKLYYPNGKLSSEGLMRNGKPDGFWRTYYPSGVLKSEGKRVNHLLDSVWVFYNEAGDTLQKVSYVLGRKNGYTIGFNVPPYRDPMDRGKIILRELYVNDKREGLSSYYFSNGQLKEEVLYLNNKKHGIAREYDLEGVIVSLLTYKNGTLIDREKINRKDENGLKQGVWKTFYDNNRINYEMNYVDDLLTGAYKEFDEGGNLKVLIQYTQGIIVEDLDTVAMDVDIQNRYDTLGNLIFSGTYRKNVPVGIHRFYAADGKVNNAYLYSDYGVKLGEGIITNEGKREGEWKLFYEDGSLKAKGRYNNNLPNGTWKYFYAQGKTEQEGQFENGKASGLWKWYFKDGSIKREEEFYQGKSEGLFVEYDTLGEAIVKGSYFDDQKEGEWYYKVGDYIEKGKYVADLKDGKWESFYLDGKLKYEGEFVQGNPDGEHKFYYSNGQLKEINYYVMGISEKNWKKYDENGLLLLTITYKDNREYRINGEKIEFAEEDIKLIQ